MRVTLKQLQVFEAVARHGSINRAAEEIALSPSAAGTALKEMEKALGVPLFERHKKQLTLNANGYRLQSRARSILNEIDDLESRAKPCDLVGTLRIASGSTVGAYLLPEICARFLKDHPRVLIQNIQVNSSEVAGRIHKMTQDIGFIDAQAARPSLKVIPWIQDELTVFCSPKHPLANKCVHPNELENDNWILPPIGTFARMIIWAAFGNVGTRIKVGMESNSVECIKRTVRTGLGIGCLSRVVLNEDFEAGKLAPIHFNSVPLHRTISIILRKDIYHAELVETFVEKCAHYAMVRQSQMSL